MHDDGGEEAERDGDPVDTEDGGGGRNFGGPAVLPRSGRVHDRDLQLRCAPCHPAKRRRGRLGLQAHRRCQPGSAGVSDPSHARRTQRRGLATSWEPSPSPPRLP